MTVKLKIGISIGVVMVVMSIIIYFVILPTVNDIKSISDAVFNERLDLEKKYLRGQLLKETIENFEKIEPEKEKLTSIFIIEGEELEFITLLEKIAETYNLTQTLKLNTPDKSTNVEYYTLSSQVSVNGEFIDVLKYLESLEQSNFYFNISSLALDTLSQGEVTANFKGNIFVAPAIDKTEEAENIE
ncbi:MAG: hypothetical protein CMI53_03030 [Parcubacteria group bacterium]|nr:hypothetical protein [Parcubacteria group bacterium]|tara:strand:+ start:276 stop:836 length:561 start_codon:yes stop_codon:yes gene_type:complete